MSADSWKLLSEFKSFKPSGKPKGTVTAEDKDYGMTKGEDFEFEPGIPSARYIRFKRTVIHAERIYLFLYHEF